MADEPEAFLISLSDRLFDELDQEFYGYPDDLSALLYRFVIENRSDIRGM